MTRRRTPPRRRCKGCGGDVYAWQEQPTCRDCQRRDENERERYFAWRREERARRRGEL